MSAETKTNTNSSKFRHREFLLCAAKKVCDQDPRVLVFHFDGQTHHNALTFYEGDFLNSITDLEKQILDGTVAFVRQEIKRVNTCQPFIVMCWHNEHFVYKEIGTEVEMHAGKFYSAGFNMSGSMQLKDLEWNMFTFGPGCMKCCCSSNS